MQKSHSCRGEEKSQCLSHFYLKDRLGNWKTIVLKQKKRSSSRDPEGSRGLHEEGEEPSSTERGGKRLEAS